MTERHEVICDGPDCTRTAQMVAVSVPPGWLVPHGWSSFNRGETFCCGNCVRAFFGVESRPEWDYVEPTQEEPS